LSGKAAQNHRAAPAVAQQPREPLGFGQSPKSERGASGCDSNRDSRSRRTERSLFLLCAALAAQVRG
jgi:hypothetical protein